MKKSKAIEQILAITKKEPEKYFDKLSDRSEASLNKLLQIVNLLKKSAV